MTFRLSYLLKICSWNIHRDIADDPNTTLGLSVPSNHGKEAMV